MSNESEILNCYTKLFPKWMAYVVLAVGIIGAFFISPTSWVFYLWISLCLLLIIKTLTQKPETEPQIVIGEKGIQLHGNEYYPYDNIQKVMAYSANKFKFRSISFKLFLINQSQVEFSVDDLDVKPQRILDAINTKIRQ